MSGEFTARPPGAAPAGRPGSSEDGSLPPRRPGSADGRDRRPARSRTLPPLPPAAQRSALSASFAESWWGDAWVRALEESSLDAGRLSRGRTYARGGYVDAITVTPGRVTAAVRGSRARPYRTTVRIPALTQEEWSGFLDAVTARPEHIAALLEKEMPEALAGAADAAGVRLLPGRGELAPSCSCPDRGHPCKHAAALCYQTARFLDRDPFVLLLLRGRDEEELLDELSRRNAASAVREAARAPGAAGDSLAGDGHAVVGSEGRGPARTTAYGTRDLGGTGDAPGSPGASAPGVLARDALATSVRPPLPAPLTPPRGPGEPPPYPGLPGAPDPADLAFLAEHAAARAHAGLADPESLTPVPLWRDTVRLAAGHPQLVRRGALSTRFAALADAAGRPAQELMRAAAAWRQGGAEGLAVLEAPWDPPAGNFDRARGALASAGLPRMSPSRNHLTDNASLRQLRYGTDGRWYPYRGVPGTQVEWWPEGPAEADPVAALTGMLNGYG